MVIRSASYRPNYVSFNIRRRVLARSPNTGAKLFAAKSRRKRLPFPRPEWDSTIHDLSVHKLSAAELTAKRALHNSRYCKLAYGSESSTNLAFGSPRSSCLEDAGYSVSATPCVGEDAAAQVDRNAEAEGSDSDANSYSASSDPHSEQDISLHTDDEQDYQSEKEEDVASEESDGSDSATTTSDSETGEQRKDTIRGDDIHEMTNRFDRRPSRHAIEEIGGSEETGSAIVNSNAHGSQDAAGTFPSMEKIMGASGWNSPTVDFEAEVMDFHAHFRTSTTAPPSSAPETQSETRGNKPTRKGAVRKLEGSTLVRGRGDGGGMQNPWFKTGLVTYKTCRAWSRTRGLCQRTKVGTRTSKSTECIQPTQGQQEQCTLDPERKPDGSFTSVEANEMKKNSARYKSSIQVTSPDGNQSEVVNASEKCSPDTELQDLHQELKQLRHHHSNLLKDFEDFRQSTEQEMKALHVVQRENQNTISLLSHKLDTKSGAPSYPMEKDGMLSAQEGTKNVPVDYVSTAIAVEVSGTKASDDGMMNPLKHLQDESTPVRSIDPPTKLERLEASASQHSSQPRKIPDFLKLRSFHSAERSPDHLSLPCFEDPHGVCLQESVPRNAETPRTTSTLNPLFSLVEEAPSAFNIARCNRAVSEPRHSWRDDYPHLGSWWVDARQPGSEGHLMPGPSASDSISVARAKFQLRGMKSQKEDGQLKSHRHRNASTVGVSFANPLYEGPTSCQMDKGPTTGEGVKKRGQDAVAMQTSYFTRNRSTVTTLKGGTGEDALPTPANRKGPIVTTNRHQGSTRTFQSRLHTYSSSQKQGTGKENINHVGLMTFRGAQTWTAAKPMLRMNST